MNRIFIFTPICAFLITYFSIPVAIKVAKKYNIYEPDEFQKKYIQKISFLGGVGIFLGVFLAHGLLFPIGASKPIYSHVLWLALFGTFLFGLGDDFFFYPPIKKFLSQFIFAAILILKSDLQLPLNELIPVLSSIPYSNLIFSIIIFSAITNAFNLIDGIDGLAGMLAVLATSAYLYLFYKGESIYFLTLALCGSGSLVAFLLYNRPSALVYMGGSGSSFIGMLIAVFTVIFISHGQSTLVNTDNRFQIGLALIALPSMDMVRVFIFRIWRGDHPFKGDYNHIHHLLMNKGIGKKMTLLIVLGIHLTLVAIALATLAYEAFLWYAVGATLFYISIIWYLKKVMIEKGRGEQVEVQASK